MTDKSLSNFLHLRIVGDIYVSTLPNFIYKRFVGNNHVYYCLSSLKNVGDKYVSPHLSEYLSIPAMSPSNFLPSRIVDYSYILPQLLYWRIVGDNLVYHRLSMLCNLLVIDSLRLSEDLSVRDRAHSIFLHLRIINDTYASLDVLHWGFVDGNLAYHQLSALTICLGQLCFPRLSEE